MIDFTETNLDVTRIVVEPGDMTRYEFYVIKDYDDFIIAPVERSFKYPQIFNKWDVKNAVNEVINGIGFNPPEPTIISHYPEIRDYLQKVENNPFEKFESDNSEINVCTVRVVALALYDVFNLGF